MKTTCTHQPKQCEFIEEGCQYMVMLFYFTDKVATIIYCPFHYRDMLRTWRSTMPLT